MYRLSIPIGPEAGSDTQSVGNAGGGDSVFGHAPIVEDTREALNASAGRVTDAACCPTTVRGSITT